MPAWRRGDPTSDLPELVPPDELDAGPAQDSEPQPEPQPVKTGKRSKPARHKTATGKGKG
jgi:hypothetical protein